MVEPVTTGALIVGGAVGAGAWLADKLFGPSADALGKELQTYGSKRLNAIFSRTQAKLLPEEVTPVPPGFALQFMQKASFSEDDDALTEAWANLLANASRKFNSRHSAYVDILSQLSAFDAIMLSQLVPEGLYYHSTMSMPVNLRLEIKLKLASELKSTSDSAEEAGEEFARLMKADLGWPGRITAARVHYKGPEKTLPITGGLPDQFASFDNLVRLGLVSRFDLDISMKPYETGLEGVLVTMLGIGFIQTCRKPV
jgi:Abortive infection alpha